MNKPANFVTRGHHFRLFKIHFRNYLCKYSFCKRIISIWNSLLDYVINSNSTLIFESTLYQLILF